MSNAGAVVGAIAAHTVIISTARNQEEHPPVESDLTDEERAQASTDFMRGYIRNLTWGFGIIAAIMLVILVLALIF